MSKKREILKLERDYLVKPGDTLLETIEYKKMTQVDLAQRIGMTPSKINDIISGKEPLSVITAHKLETVLGIDAQFWSNLESNYRTELARIDREEKLLEDLEWAKEQPIKVLQKFGYITTTNNDSYLVKDICHFYGVAGKGPWQSVYCSQAIMGRFRKNPKSKLTVESLAAVLRMGEIGMAKINVSDYNKTEFRKCLEEINPIVRSQPEDFPSRLQDYCSKAGVAIVFTPSIPGAQISGVSRWVNDNPLIQLTDRYKSNDEFWISFYHEAGHVVNHGKKDLFIEDSNEFYNDEEKEKEADDFAFKTLLSNTNVNKLPDQLDETNIRAIARDNNIHPAIVLKLLQNIGRIAFSFGNHLKVPIRLDKFINVSVK